MYKIRIILDTKKDVLRTITIDETCNLEQLHFAIANAFGFDGREMASFYRTDEEWNQGEEIPLFSMAEAGKGISMATCLLKNTLVSVNGKLIYVYDFLNMWSFYIELLEISEGEITDAKVILAVGEVPLEAPEPEFKADNFGLGDFEDELNDGYDNFERLDDFDFDNY